MKEKRGGGREIGEGYLGPGKIGRKDGPHGNSSYGPNFQLKFKVRHCHNPHVALPQGRRDTATLPRPARFNY